MIIRKNLPLTRIFHFVANRVLLFFAFDLIVTVAYVGLGQHWVSIAELPLSLLGAALTVFLAFRIKAAYDRWWEARILWGGLVNWSRTLVRRCLMLATVPADFAEQSGLADAQRRITYLQIAYVHALRCHLRGHDCLEEMRNWLPAEEVAELRNQENIPMVLQLRMGEAVRQMYRSGWLDTFRLVSIEEALAEITNVQGACERIKTTPFPRQFDYFPKLFTNIFCLLAPLGLVASIGALTPLASTLIALMLLSLESFGRHLETPFENTINDIPMSALSRMIEINLKRSLGERHVPELLRPVEGFLF